MVEVPGALALIAVMAGLGRVVGEGTALRRRLEADPWRIWTARFTVYGCMLGVVVVLATIVIDLQAAL